MSKIRVGEATAIWPTALHHMTWRDFELNWASQSGADGIMDQIVPENWIEVSTRTHMSEIDRRGSPGYGYQWWTSNLLKTRGRGRPGRDRAGAWRAGGHFPCSCPLDLFVYGGGYPACCLTVRTGTGFRGLDKYVLGSIGRGLVCVAPASAILNYSADKVVRSDEFIPWLDHHQGQHCVLVLTLSWLLSRDLQMGTCSPPKSSTAVFGALNAALTPIISMPDG